MKWLIAGIAIVVGAVVAGAVGLALTTDESPVESADVLGQGGGDVILVEDGARLERSSDGLRVRATMPTPVAGSYEYPSGDMTPPWSTPHPEVLVGSPSHPEAFTMWTIVFNHPELCTEDSCDLDDLAPGAAAMGGVYQGDGRVADGDAIEMSGAVRLGETPETGSALVNPLGAEVHLAIAPHGMMLEGSDGWRQLNGPLGNPTLWWAAVFAS